MATVLVSVSNKLLFKTYLDIGWDTLGWDAFGWGGTITGSDNNVSLEKLGDGSGFTYVNPVPATFTDIDPTGKTIWTDIDVTSSSTYVDIDFNKVR